MRRFSRRPDESAKAIRQFLISYDSRENSSTADREEFVTRKTRPCDCTRTQQQISALMERKVFLDQSVGGGCAQYSSAPVPRETGDVHSMTKTASKKYSGVDARDRFDQAPNDAPSAPLKLILTATMKRRALKKKPEKSDKKGREGLPVPAMTSFLLHDQNDRDQS